VPEGGSSALQLIQGQNVMIRHARDTKRLFVPHVGLELIGSTERSSVYNRRFSKYSLSGNLLFVTSGAGGSTAELSGVGQYG
jgi:hypothetical protein